MQHTASLDEPVQMFVQDMFAGTKDPVELPKNTVDISDSEQRDNSTTTLDVTPVQHTASLDEPVQMFVQDMFVATKDPVEIPKNNVVISDEQPAELGSVSTPDLSKRVETEQQEDSSIVDDFAGLKMVVDGYAVNQTGLMKHVAETLAQIKPDVITKSMLAVEQAPNADLIIQTGIEVTLFKRLANDASHFAHEYVKEAAGNIILAKVENYEEVAELLPTMNPDNDELIGYLIVDLKKAIEIADNLDRLNQYATLVEEKCQHIAESFQALQEQAADFGKLLAETSGNSLSKSQEIELDDILRTTEDLLGHTIDRTPLTQREKKALAKDLNLSEIEALMRLDEKLGHGTPELDLFDDSYFSLDGLEPKSSNPTDLGVDTKKIVVEKPVLTTSQSELMEYFDQIEDSPISDKDVAAFVEELNGLPISQVQPAQVQSKQLTESEVASVESFVNDAVRAPVQTISVEPTPTIDPLLVQEVSELRREIDDINNELAVYKKLLEEQAKLKEQAEVDAFTQDITAPSTVPVVPQIESDDVVNTFVKDAVGPLLPNLVQSVLDISKAPNPSNGLLTGASLVDTVLDTPHPQEATKLVTDVIGDVQGMMKNSSNAQPTQAASIFSGLFTGVLKNVGGEQKAKKASLITFQSATGNLPVIALQQPRRGRFAARKPLDQKTVAPKVVKEKVDVEVDKVKVDNFLDDIFATQPATNSTPSLVVPVVETVDQTQKTLLPASSPVHSSGEKSVLSTSDVIQHESDIVGLDVSPQPIRVDLLLEAKHLLENAQLKLEVAQQQFAEAKGELTILSENEIVGADLLGIQLANKEPHQQAEAALKLKDEANVKLQQALNEVNVELHGPSDESAAPTVEAIQIELSKLIVANTISPEDGKLGETDFGQMMINIDKQGHFDKFKQMSDRIEHLDSTAKAWKSVSDAFDNLVTTEKAVKEADMLHADATKGYEEIQVDQLVHEMNRQHVDLHAGEQTLQTAAPILPQIETVVTGEAHL
ncbi:MAG: hypothetical protein HYX61_05900 [Gammaproteobacteria bacterium]|nr:hypothetical protein [Gammaproteobacteria bacterium]